MRADNHAVPHGKVTSVSHTGDPTTDFELLPEGNSR
jgi:hypothetical protein